MPAFPVSSLAADDASSAALLQTLLAVSLTGVILFSPVYDAQGVALVDLTYEYLNPAAQQMLGLPERPAESFLTLFPHAADQEGVFAFYRDTYLSGQSGRHQFNYQYDGLDGYFYLAAQRQGPRLVVSFTDTNDQPRTVVEDALRASQAKEQAARAEADLQRQRLYNMFAQAPAMICIFDGPQHTFQFVNPPYQALVGERPLVGKPIAEAMPELVGQPIFGLLDQVYQTGETFYANEMLVQLDHQNEGRHTLEKRYYNFIYQARHDLGGAIDGILVFANDVTPQVQARQQVEQAHREVQNLNEELATSNEELRASNEEYLLTNTALQQAQLELAQLNQELEARVRERTHSLVLAQAAAERQRSQLAQLFQQAPASICILRGPNLVYELVNPGYQQLFSGRALLGKPLLSALPELEGSPIWNTLRHVYATGQTHVDQAVRILLAQPENALPEDLYLNYVFQARYDEWGQIDGVLVFAFDVTMQVRAQQASEASAQQLRLLTDALPVLISYVDRQRRYQFANEAYRSWFNQDPAALLGRPVQEVLGPQAYAATQGYMNRVLAGERLAFNATMPYRADFVKHIHTDYLPDIRQGEVVGFYALVTDVTEQTQAREHVQRLNEELAAINEELQASNEELHNTNIQLTRTNVDLDNFVYTASHDLKAPIANIEGLLLALQRELPAACQVGQVPTMLQLMQEAIERFGRTIGSLTDISRLQQAHAQPATQVRLAPVVREVQLDLAFLVAQTGAQVQVAIPEDCMLLFSEKNLRSVVYNLLSNALKYHHPDRRPVVQVTYRPEAKYQVLQVQDNGLGLDLTQDQEKLFAMFQRLHTHVEGSGVGLYMVKKMVENAGGHIEVHSKPNQGATFSVYFLR